MDSTLWRTGCRHGGRDAEDLVVYYVAGVAEAAAPDFIGALAKAYRHIGRHPASRPTRYAHEPNLPGLRCCPLTRCPCLVSYVERPDHVDVWSVLHGQRDIPAWMQEPEGA
ncbi:MAG: type II toxin-antitoxin system RelE/ParE family toxin [Burkholderiales bacterium]|nr:MAG: type II toxin-antitoxin system RelE/ParE family toxin [Burkholderiales bacterium]